MTAIVFVYNAKNILNYLTKRQKQCIINLKHRGYIGYKNINIESVKNTQIYAIIISGNYLLRSVVITKFNTALLHKNFNGDKATGSTLTPIYQVSAFSHGSAEELEKVFNNRSPGFSYTRVSNPTVTAFENRMAGLENGVAAIACSSGMNAVTMSLLNILQEGDEIIASSALYGGTIDLFGDLAAFGIKTKFVTGVTPENVEPLITDKTKVLFAEVIGNPKLDVVDIEAVAKLLHKHNIPFIVDSTTATPYLVRPFDYGADVVIHSTSKYINGSGSAVSGVIIDSGKFDFVKAGCPGFDEYKRFGKFAYIAKLRNGIWRNMGGCLSPMNAFVNSIGLETLGIRMERLCDNAQKLAEFFERTDGIEVNYPGLKSNPYHALAEKQFGGKGGAIITIRVGSKERAFKLIDSLKYATIASNVGDSRTLVLHPASTISCHNTPEQMHNAGVYDDTIRISVGLEDIDDLIDDFAQAVKNL